MFWAATNPEDARQVVPLRHAHAQKLPPLTTPNVAQDLTGEPLASGLFVARRVRPDSGHDLGAWAAEGVGLLARAARHRKTGRTALAAWLAANVPSPDALHVYGPSGARVP